MVVLIVAVLLGVIAPTTCADVPFISTSPNSDLVVSVFDKDLLLARTVGGMTTTDVRRRHANPGGRNDLLSRRHAGLQPCHIDEIPCCMIATPRVGGNIIDRVEIQLSDDTPTRLERANASTRMEKFEMILLRAIYSCFSVHACCKH